MNTVTSQPRRRSMRDCLRVLFRRKTLFLVTLAAIFLSGLLISLRLPNSYTAEATVVRQATPWVNQPGDQAPAQALWPKLSEPQVQELIGTHSVIEQGLRRAGLYKAGDGVAVRRERAAMADRVRLGIEARLVGDFIHVRYAGTDPRRAAAIANGLALALVDQVVGGVQAQAKQAVQAAAGSLEDARLALEEARQRMATFRDRHVESLETDAGAVYREWQQVKKDLKDIDERLAGLQASREVLAKRAAELPATQVTHRRYVANPAYRRMKTRLEELEAKRDRLMLTRTELHPEVRSVQRSIALAEAELKDTQREIPDQREEQVNAQRGSLLTKIADIDARLLALRMLQDRRRPEVQNGEQRWREQRRIDAEREELTDAVQAAESEYARKQERLSRTQDLLAAAMEQRGFRFQVWEPAEAPQVSDGPKVGAYAVLSLVLGLAVALGLVFFAEFNDSSFRSFDDASRYLEVPVVGAVAMIETDSTRRWREIRGQVLAVVGTLLCAAAAVTLLLVVILSIHSPRFFEAFLDDPIAGIGRAYAWVFRLLGI